MSERHLKLLTKLIPFLTFLLFWQLGCEFKFQSTAQQGPYSSKSCGTYVRNCDSTSSTGPLPWDEVYALRAFISKLGLMPAPSISPSFCSDKGSYGGMTIICNCTYANSSVCHITDIIMSNLNLRGSIHPGVSNLTYLERLDLSDNQLTGPIPRSLGNLGNLTALFLYKNFLEEEIPSTLGLLSSLQYLSLSNNLLTGKIPKDLGNLTKLISLRLDENQLSGPLPEGLSRLSNLWYLSLTSNNLTREVPKSYEQLRGLYEFAIAGNNLDGPIPKFITSWTNLTELILLGNNFEGHLPMEIFEMEKLDTLWVSDLNNSGFPFPQSANLTNIFSLILRNCSISGSIPKYIGNWSSLRSIDLSFNNLTGEIPDSIRNLTLSGMYLSRNMLSGTIPYWLLNLTQTTVDLSYNNFTDIEVSERTNQSMNLYEYNNFTDIEVSERTNQSISSGGPNRISLLPGGKKYCPDGKSKDPFLFINCGGKETTIEGNNYDADNSTSNFNENSKGNWAYSCSGDFISSSANSSDYIKNMTCGVSVLEASLYAEARLCPLSLTYYGFCLQKGNYSVKLHFVETVYTEATDYSSLGKRVFDVYIQGVRVLKDFNIKEKAGGPNKPWTENFTASVDEDPLVIHFFWAGKGSINNPPALNGPLVSAISVTPDFKVGGGKLSRSNIALITVASVITPLLLLAFVWKMGWLCNRELDAKTYIKLLHRSVTLKELIDATQNFSSKKEIGRGRFAKVYKAEVMSSLTVAVKKLSHQSMEAMEGIEREFYALKSLGLENVVHENVLQFFDGHFGKDLRLIIFEYMENNSLEQALFDSNSTFQLNWKERFDICLGIATGLKYLHCNGIVHRNIKASNILLDHNLKAKVSDFGLTRFYGEEDLIKAIKTRGTCVYMAPECATGREITDKADVYSFGVVLLEIVSGTSNSKFEENKETNFPLQRACKLHPNGNLVELVDEKLSTYNREQAITILELAMMCIDDSPTIRPTMSEVVSVLQGEKTIPQISKAVTPKSVLWPINDINDPQVKEIGEFAVSEYDKKSIANLKFESVVQVEATLKFESVVQDEARAVSGINYRLIVAAKHGVATNNYEAIVWEKPWEHSKNLTSFEPVKG